MGHVPHLYLGGPWGGDDVGVAAQQRSHLERVLRVEEGSPVSYTDGAGLLGDGRYRRGVVVRGEEERRDRPSDLIVVAAPPDSRDRLRFMVEKLAELGVAELRLLATRRGEGRSPRADRLRSWAVAGLEQSRGAWLMVTGEGLVTFSNVSGPFAVCDPAGGRDLPRARTVVIGPEGGWEPDEVPEGAIRFGLGDTVLRVETAAIVAAARLL